MERLRISSVEPMDWSAELFELIAEEPRIARHVHLPLQSGSDAVLKRMFRKYRTRHYATRLEIARRLMADAAIGADVMTGFPGETDAEFEETVRFIEAAAVYLFACVHVFGAAGHTRGGPGSKRADGRPAGAYTPAARAFGSKNLEFRRRMIGTRLAAVTLEQRGMALTSNFLKVEMSGARAPNQLVNLEIGSATETGLRERSLLPVI